MTQKTTAATGYQKLLNDERVDLTFRLNHAARLLRGRFDSVMQSFDLTRAQWRALLYIARLSNPTQSELAEVLESGRASVGVLIDQLEQQGYVCRVKDSDDRRVWRIALTKQAIIRQKEIEQSGLRVVDEVFAGFDDRELRTLGRCLDELIKGID